MREKQSSICFLIILNRSGGIHLHGRVAKVHLFGEHSVNVLATMNGSYIALVFIALEKYLFSVRNR